MSILLTELSERARELPSQERAQLAQELLGSLQEWSSLEVESDWDAEVLKRIEQVDRGEVQLTSAAEVFEQASRLTQ